MTASASPVRAPEPAAEYELKFVLANAHVQTVLPWLRMCCRPHERYAHSLISSIYYDYADWRLLGSKIDSFHLKNKVRLRWYSDPEGRCHPEGVWLEGKFKVGPQRRKVRIKTELSRDGVRGLSLDAPGLASLPELLRAHGVMETSGLTPVFQIDYTRRRFVHSASRCVFCLDADIHVPRVNPMRLPRTNPAHLAAAVLEQKGPLDRLSPAVDFLPHFHLKKGAFSKYARCFRHLTDS